VSHTYVLRPATYGRMYEIPPATFQYTETKDETADTIVCLLAVF
jgi:hypothetical protein